MFRGTNIEKLLDKATSHLLMEPDFSLILQITDLIRQGDVQARVVLTALKKKLTSPNPHTAEFALLVLESLMKNCGTIVHDELTAKSYCEFLHEFCRSTPHENVRSKLLELIQSWNYALRKSPKHGALKDLMATMKSEGYKFPTLQESDAMFSADTAPEWVEGSVCHRCRVQFSLIQRRHHCRACGQIFCGQCSSKSITLPKYGIEKEVRVCDSCYDDATKSSSSKSSSLKSEVDLPLEYLKSSLAQQKQEPPKKSEDELKEEEDLQLALALSQSEAEAKAKEKSKSSSLINNYKDIEINDGPIYQKEEQSYPEMQKYLNRSYWESVQSKEPNETKTQSSPSAPEPIVTQNNDVKFATKENGTIDNNLEDFIRTLKSQVEIFINRMKSDSSRGRYIANDTSVQTLFMNITAMHSQLLCHIQEHDDGRIHFERLQDKLTQVKDARAALDSLREEHREKMRHEAEEAERQRQLQMAHKLDVMRKKKQEYLQYQRQLALQRIQEQEREMKMRQEQQKQQYMYGSYIGSPVHGQPYQQNPVPAPGAYPNYQFPQHINVQTSPTQMGVNVQGASKNQPMGHPPTNAHTASGSNNPLHYVQQKMPSQIIVPPVGMGQQPVPVGMGQQPIPVGMSQQQLPQNQAALQANQGIPSASHPHSQVGLPPGQGNMAHQIITTTPTVGMTPKTDNVQSHLPQGQMQPVYQLMEAPREKDEPTAELISFD